ncbi:hypothetical protein GE061_013862 [Apolygus lucorum]|uniref:Lipase domain-containing protein n=1 Tax=Apolygus lucorum TaxID=248454 RepID=A0A8S9XNX6_APOLU|nr:hypothetical protein GE061_013862 [Apolygus lucorum]
MDRQLFVFPLIFLITCSGSFSKPTENTSAAQKKYDKYLVDSSTLELVDQQLRAANPALNDYRSSVLFYLYTKSTLNSPQLLQINNSTQLKSSNYVSSKKTIVVTHGYMDSVHSDITQKIKNALLEFNDVNVIGIDWSYYTKNIIYSWVAGETSGVGNYVGRFVTFLIEQGLSTENVHLIGHSLGAHVSGFAGKTLKANGYTAARVTGLDPALPGFNGNDDSSRLASTDGNFVDCIHTCGGLLGFDVPICQADFFPNGGINVQPGCTWLDFGACSHGRSFEYFAESIDSTHHFYSEMCNAVVDGVPYGCSNDGAEMGYFANPEILGEFYLTTASSSPFSLNITTSAD